MKPLIAIPMGDAAGIGPEITVKTIASEEAFKYARMIVVGNKRVLETACKFSDINLKINPIPSIRDFNDQPGVMNLIERGDIDFSTFRQGEIQGQCGKAAYDCIEEVVRMAMSGDVDAVATTPINKESLKAGHVNFIGHTEIFGQLTDTPDPLTMFQVRDLRVFFLTRHMSLVNAIRSLTPEKVCDYAIRCTHTVANTGCLAQRMMIFCCPVLKWRRPAGFQLQVQNRLTAYFTSRFRENTMLFCPPTMIRDISRPRWWIFIARYLSPMVCPSCVRPSTTVLPMTLQEKGSQTLSV